jgi:hypothetical protein
MKRDIWLDIWDICQNRDVPIAGHFGTSPVRGVQMPAWIGNGTFSC